MVLTKSFSAEHVSIWPRSCTLLLLMVVWMVIQRLYVRCLESNLLQVVHTTFPVGFLYNHAKRLPGGCSLVICTTF